MTVADWIAGCILWANLPVPVYWLVLHPGAAYWRRNVRAGYVTAVVAGWGSASVLAWLYAGRLLNASAIPPLVKWAGALLVAVDLWILPQVERQMGARRLVGHAELAGGGEMKTDGLYARVRHPRYAAMMVSTLGACLLAARLAMWCVTAVWMVAVWLMIRAEERELVGRFGAAYEEYRRRVPAIIPRLTARAAVRGGSTGG